MLYIGAEPPTDAFRCKMAGALVYNGCLKGVALKPMLVWCVILVTVLGSTDLVLVSGLNRKLWISDEV